MKSSSRSRRFAALLAGAVAALALSACDKPATEAGGPVSMHRLTQEQYRNVIADVFGDTVTLGGRFEPDVREGGLLAVGASQISVTASGFEQYDKMARSIAAQVVDPNHRELMVPCQPADPKAADEACARTFLSRAGKLLYRRPLTDRELQAHVEAAGAATQKVGDFYNGLGLSLAGLLASPQFLFRQELTEPDPDKAGQQRLTGYSKAARLSFFLWNSAPDPELLAAAESGELHTEKGLARQVDRMLASRRLEAGVRAFFADMLGFEVFDNLAKDPTLYPKFTLTVAGEAQEQTLRTISQHLLVEKGDYRDLFTTRKTFLTPLLGSVYRVPVLSRNGLPDGWVPYEFAKESGHAGILTHASFVGLHSHPGRTSPTLRGKALREVLLCQKVPDPPANVNFNVFQDTANPNMKTVRERLVAHATDPSCTGCHKVTDPIGLAMENFDTIGGFRTEENGAKIDTTGDLDGTAFTDAAGLGKAVHDNPAAASCLVNRVYAYAVGRKPTKSETAWLDGTLGAKFASDGYRVPDLLRRIATSDVFYRITPPDTQAKPATVAQAETN